MCPSTRRTGRSDRLHVLAQPHVPAASHNATPYKLDHLQCGFVRVSISRGQDAAVGRLMVAHFATTTACTSYVTPAASWPHVRVHRRRSLKRREDDGTGREWALAVRSSTCAVVPRNNLHQSSLKSTSRSLRASVAMLPAKLIAARVAATPSPSTRGLLSAPLTAISAPT